MMVCTAGHVDHGKTRLVKMLTGCNTDRLKIEQERGLTIELGFAPCCLGGKLCVGIVDVPGHEKFIRNMVAGVSGIDLTILVVAADDGIMPQTIEHFQIMDLLGVRRGIIALTKIDLVTPERVAEVIEDLRVFTAGTFLDGAPICPVSSETGEGFWPFYETLVSAIRAAEQTRRAGIFRMPIERVFLRKGFGAVATGIPLSGQVRVGDEVELAPGGQRGHIRGIQCFLRQAEEGASGQCLALNVPEFGKTPPERGQSIAAPGYLQAASFFGVRLRAAAGIDTPLRNAEQVRLHTGTSEQPGKVYLLDQEQARESEPCWAVLALSEPIAVVPHDRFILRRISPATTVAGGDIWAIYAGANRPRKKQALDELVACAEALGDAEPFSEEGQRRRLRHFFHTADAPSASLETAARAAYLPIETARARLDILAASGELLALEDGHYADAGRFQEGVALLKERLEQGGAIELNTAALQQELGWPAPFWRKAQAGLKQQGATASRTGRMVLRGALERLPEDDRALLERILTVYEENAFQSPRPDELPELLGASEAHIEKLLQLACAEGLLIRLAKNVVLSYSAMQRAQTIAVEAIQRDGKLDSADFKYRIESTRKYAIAILDYLDKRRVTIRRENLRMLAYQYERNLL